ncbi:hypothetical protein [Caulobacter vibrioides]|nr:hypothetical protein [Caulobacter vibrioides]
MQVALGHYAGAPQLKPFASQVEGPQGERRQRLFGVAEPQARKLLSACSIDAWKHVSTLRAPADGDPKDGERLFHLWVCERTDGKLMAAELWRPHMGVDGVYFAACAPTVCPSYPQAFPEIRAWLGDTFEPVAERPPQ